MRGVGRRYGSLALKALRYRSVDFERTKAGLLGALCNYSGSPADALLEDDINGFTQVCAPAFGI
jgi:hypothetical protein